MGSDAGRNPGVRDYFGEGTLSTSGGRYAPAGSGGIVAGPSWVPTWGRDRRREGGEGFRNWKGTWGIPSMLGGAR